jgi:hypothetical protein
MADSAIKAEVFARSKVKKKVAENNPKSRTTLLQKGESGVEMPTLHAAPIASIVSYKETIQFGTISNIFGNDMMMTKGTLAGKKIDEFTVDRIQLDDKPSGSFGNSSVMGNSMGKVSSSHCKELKTAETIVSKSQFGSQSNCLQHDKIMKVKDVTVPTMEKSVEIIPKPKTALFQGREDDEPMAPQIIKFGSFLFSAKKSKSKREILANVSASKTKLIFQGNNFCKEDKNQGNKSSKYIFIGTMQVDIT